MKMLIFISIMLLTGILAGCGEDELKTLRTDSSAVARKRAGDLTFTLQILNMQGKPQDRFQEGENFQFQFIIENDGRDRYILPVAWVFPFTSNEFFALYRKDQEIEDTVRLGKSFKSGSNTLDLLPELVPARGATIYTMPWLTENDSVYIMPECTVEDPINRDRYYIAAEDPTSPVRPGDYFTGFTIPYNEKDSVRMEVSFRVE